MDFTVLSPKTATDGLKQLKENYEILLRDELNISLAEKTCSDAWHLADWVYSEFLTKDPMLSKKKIRARIHKECPEMKILHDLVNTFKHKELTSPKTFIRETKIHRGCYSSDYSNDYDLSRLEVYFDNNTKIDVDNLVNIAINYWGNLINR